MEPEMKKTSTSMFRSFAYLQVKLSGELVAGELWTVD